MTVSSTQDRQLFNGDGSNKLFPFNFRFFENNQIRVYVVQPNGSMIGKTLGDDYTLSGANSATGGQVSMIVAPAATEQLLVRRVLSVTQPTSIRNQGAFFPSLHEDAFDRLTMLIQQAFGEIEAATGLPASTVLQSLAALQGEAGQVIFFDGQGGVNAKLSRALIAEIANPLTYDDGATAGWTSEASFIGNGNKLNHFRFYIKEEDAQRPGVNGATGSKVNGVHIIHIMGGPNAFGGRHALEVTALFGFGSRGAMNPDNTDNFFVPLQSQGIADTNNGGTLVTPRGAMFGTSCYGALTGLAQYWANLTGSELNTEISGSQANQVAYHSVFQTASYFLQRAYQVHCVWGMSNLGGSTIGNKFGILIGAMNGRHCFDADSVFLKLQAAGNGVMQTMFDLTGNTFSDSILRSDGTVLGDGTLALTKPNSSLIIGTQAQANTPVILLRSSGTAANYDVRMLSVGGTSTAGNGTFQVDTSGSIFGGTVIRASQDGVQSIGSAAFRASQVFAVNATIQTSDMREKDLVGHLDFGLNMIERLEPIVFTWKQGDGQLTREITGYEEYEEDETELVDEEQTEIEMIDGQPVQVKKTVQVKRIVYDEVTVTDGQGNPAMADYFENQTTVPLDANGMAFMDRMGEPIVIKESVKKQRIETIKVPRKIKKSRPVYGEVVTYGKGKRPHWGMSAQQVKETMDVLGIDDFAGWTLADENDPESRQGLRYEEFVPLLINGVKELSQENKQLRSMIEEMALRLDKLEAKGEA